ncbi:MAG: hypothetical protein ACRD03_10480 [Acidimicrobiales bacterium]
MSSDGPLSDAVVAVVLTHQRRLLATELVRNLVDVEGFAPQQVILVVNGEGGLDDPALEGSLRVERLPRNVGPAGGFRHGLATAAAIPGVDWIYLCEDDVGLFSVPAPRVRRLIADVKAFEQGSGAPPVGAVVAYGRDLDRRTGGTTIHRVSSTTGFDDVDAASWGASLVSAAVVEAGVLPDESWFFGYEDFDFWFRLKNAGFRLLVDRTSAARTEPQMTSAGREHALGGRRSLDAEEPWRAYYVARNFFLLARRHGDRLWTANHLLYSLRRMQLARSNAERVATMRGLWDGLLGRTGHNPAIGPVAPGADQLAT